MHGTLDHLAGQLRFRRERHVIASGGPRHERFVHQPGLDDLAADGIRQRDVGADIDAEPRVGLLCRRRAPRVSRVQPGAAPDALQHVMEEDRVHFTRVRPPQHEQVGVFLLPVGAGAASIAPACSSSAPSLAGTYRHPAYCGRPDRSMTLYTDRGGIYSAAKKGRQNMSYRDINLSFAA